MGSENNKHGVPFLTEVLQRCVWKVFCRLQTRFAKLFKLWLRLPADQNVDRLRMQALSDRGQFCWCNMWNAFPEGEQACEQS